MQACEHCGCQFTPGRRRKPQKYCTRACSHAARTREQRVEAGRKGGLIAAERKQRSAHLQRTVHLGNVRQQAYRLGYQAGYEFGYEQAVQRMLAVQR